MTTKSKSLFSIAQELAETIFDEYEAWDSDQDEPASLRSGARHPGSRALELARIVRHLNDSDVGD